MRRRIAPASFGGATRASGAVTFSRSQCRRPAEHFLLKRAGPGHEDFHMFDKIAAPPADPVYDAMARYDSDARPERTDLGIGGFHDEQGKSPVLAAVAEAEHELARARESKAYLPLARDPQFLEAFRSLINPNEQARAAVIQSTGATGAVRLAC